MHNVLDPKRSKEDIRADLKSIMERLVGHWRAWMYIVLYVAGVLTHSMFWSSDRVWDGTITCNLARGWRSSSLGRTIK